MSRITALFDEHGLLPPQHKGAHPWRLTDIALDMLVKQIQVAWLADNEVAFQLLLEITVAFDRVVLV